MPHVKMLDADNFDSHVSSGLSGMTKGTLVAFVASWCGHCKRLKPTYEKLAEAFDGEMFVDIAMIDADKHRKIGEKYNVAGFPTIKWFSRASDKPEDYNGGRSLSDLIKFVNEKAGTKVSDDGLYSKTAGVIEDLTDDVKKMVNTAKPEEQKTYMEKIKEYGSKVDTRAREYYDYYERVLSKYASDGADYVRKEKERIMGILRDQKDNLVPEKKKSFMQRLNILNIFSKDEL